MENKKIKAWGLAIFFLLLSLYFGNEALIRFNSGEDFIGMVLPSILAIGCLIGLGDNIKKIKN